MTTLPTKNIDLLRRVLQENYLDLSIRTLRLDENAQEGRSTVQIVTAVPGGQEETVQGAGVGLVDALFSALFSRYAAEYQSLRSIRLTGFFVQAKLDADRASLGADAVGEVVLEVQNSYGIPFRFSNASRSIVASAATAVLAAVEFFVNSERAFVSLHHAYRAAQERKRPDLVAKYAAEMSEVVSSTSYAEVIESLKKQL